MTKELQREALKWVLVSALAILFGFGSGWASAAVQDTLQNVAIADQKQELEALRTEVQEALAELKTVIYRVDGRVAEMYCDGKPPGCR